MLQMPGPALGTILLCHWSCRLGLERSRVSFCGIDIVSLVHFLVSNEMNDLNIFYSKKYQQLLIINEVFL